ncbi:hypothetical protein D5086_006000, partial [Populus alba]
VGVILVMCGVLLGIGLFLPVVGTCLGKVLSPSACLDCIVPPFLKLAGFLCCTDYQP